MLALLGSFWVVVGVLDLSELSDSGLASGAQVLGVLMLANGGALWLAARSCLRGHRLVDYVAVLLLAANAGLSVTDEIGLLDGASLLVAACC